MLAYRRARRLRMVQEEIALTTKSRGIVARKALSDKALHGLRVSWPTWCPPRMQSQAGVPKRAAARGRLARCELSGGAPCEEPPSVQRAFAVHFSQAQRTTGLIEDGDDAHRLEAALDWLAVP